jgi:hypothetical protein
MKEMHAMKSRTMKSHAANGGPSTGVHAAKVANHSVGKMKSMGGMGHRHAEGGGGHGAHASHPHAARGVAGQDAVTRHYRKP